MSLFDPGLSAYLEGLISERPLEMEAMEKRAKETSFPIIGPVAGFFCYTIARMTNARRIFEMGSGFGYSTAWFAQAVEENGGGEVFHVVWDEDLSQEARRHLGALGYDRIVRYRIGEATAALAAEAGPFDLIFNDIDKDGYPDSLPVIAEKLKPGGVLIVDNMLMGGKIFDLENRSPALDGVRRFTAMILGDDAWVSSLIPIRDGLMLAYKSR
ncbi:MAG TPA: O-methyltransferase [Anaerolineales bacterium]|nr:O-methyltransferase [Anaerolineales bacterium]